MMARVAQVVFTVTQFPSVDAVEFEIKVRRSPPSEEKAS